jgi:outer membrane protein, heavy metal efflux system
MFYALVCLSLSTLPTSPPPVRLTDLVEEARRKNPEIRAAREQAHADRLVVDSAGTLDDPMLMVELWNMPVDLSTVPVMVNLTQAIPLGGKRAARRDEAEAMAAGAEATVSTRARDVEAQLAKAYFDLFLADRTISVDDEIGRTLQSLIAAALGRVGAGRGDASEALRAESEGLKVQSDREAASARRTAAVSKLVALLDRPPGTDLGPTSEPGLLASLPAPEALRARAVQERPEFAAASAATAAAVARVQLAKAATTPDLGVSLGEMHMFGGTSHPADFLFIGAQANLPIFGTKNRGRIASAEAGVGAMREEAHALQNRVFAEIADAFAEVQAEARQTELHHQLIPLSRQALAGALAAYAAGRGGFAPVLDTERELQMHELDLAMHLAAYAQHLTDLERAVGSDIGLLRAAEAGTHVSHEESP